MKKGFFVIAFLFLFQSFFLYKEFLINNKLNKTIEQKYPVQSQSVCDSILNIYKPEPATIYDGEPAKVNFNSMPELKNFYTLITEEASMGPNFAGHFTFIEWGCGISCLSYAIVDAISGKIVLFKPVLENSIPSYNVNSKLLTFNEKNEFNHLKGKNLKEIIDLMDTESGKLREYYELIEEKNGEVWLYRLCSENVLDGIYSLDEINL